MSMITTLNGCSVLTRTSEPFRKSDSHFHEGESANPGTEVRIVAEEEAPEIKTKHVSETQHALPIYYGGTGS